MTGTPLLTPSVQEGPPGSAAIAAGAAGTVRAGARVLAAGGNAADAALAAMAASPMSEPSLTSMGGGGFMLVRQPDGTATVVDFFVDTPGLGSLPRRPSSFIPITLHYPGTVQTFHVGAGSVAVPGCVAGLLDAHAAFGRLPIADVLAPAIEMAVQGWAWEPMQVQVLQLVLGIFESAAAGRELVRRSGGDPIEPGDTARIPEYGAMLAGVADGTITGLSSPALAEPILRLMSDAGGLVTAADLEQYRVYHRAPIALHRHGSDILTNPSPSFGGPIIVDALARTGKLDGSPRSWSEAAHNLIRATEYNRRSELGPPPRRSKLGTTHISVIDADGMVASLTTSNGAGSGVWVPGIGLHLNNMLGEEDLNPAGFHAVPPGLRIGSMMSPTVVRREDGTLLAMGTGGSSRIRSALFEVLLRTVDLGQSAAESIVAPRFHPNAGTVQVEPGWPTDVVEALGLDLEVNLWPSPGMYFGGVHTVMRRPDGSVQAVGDPRREGATSIVTADGRIIAPGQTA